MKKLPRDICGRTIRVGDWLDRWHAKRLALWVLISLLVGFVSGVWVDHECRPNVSESRK